MSEGADVAREGAAGARAGDAVLELRELHVRFATADGEVHAVRGIDCRIGRGECVGIVGESGSGKSQTFLAALGLLAANGRAAGVALHGGRDLLALSARELERVRGDGIAMIFQNPLTSLTPHLTIGTQMRETLVAHRRVSARAARSLSLEWLERVALPEPERRFRQYPHELSGGMRQRVMIATAMLCEPDLLIADEPTTALDVTIQAEILELMDALRRDTGTGIALITHDMGVVARLCDRVHVMRAGEFVESGDVDAVFHAPRHPYTRELLAAVPRIDIARGTDGASDVAAAGPAMGAVSADADGAIPTAGATPADRGGARNGGRHEDAVLAARGVAVRYRLPGSLLRRGAELRAVDGVDLRVDSGETLGVVGESGSGKSTLARALLGLIPRDAGEVAWLGRPLDAFSPGELRRARRDFSIVFQDPLASLDPAMTVGGSVAEPLRVAEPALSRAERRARVGETLERVGLGDAYLNRYPHELSGGQNQRVGIARAVVTRPRLVVCDEAVSALDVSVQARILALLAELQRDLGLAMLFISHDLAVIRQVAHRVLVMYLGNVVELAPRDALFDDPRHPYTRQLISAVPVPDPRVERGRGRIRLRPARVPPSDPAAALRFVPSRLGAYGEAIARPRLVEVGPAHLVAEHDPLETLLAG